jgi:uncharacterized protein (TIGR02147 family)
MTEKNIFEFSSYKTYLEQIFGGKQVRTGARKKAADWIGCHTAYLSLVLNGEANLSLEQAFRLNDFLGHDPDEREYFLTLVQLERAGTKDLESYFKEKIHQQILARSTIRGRLKSEEGLSHADQAIYYSKWYYACIHVLISIPEMQSRTALANHLHLPISVVSEVLDFLEKRGLAVVKEGRYQIGPRHLHLPENSPYIGKHHSNWRQRALLSLDLPQKNDLHYSVVVTLSQQDAVKLRESMMDLIKSNMEIVSDSKEECAFGFSMDYFQV